MRNICRNFPIEDGRYLFFWNPYQIHFYHEEATHEEATYAVEAASLRLKDLEFTAHNKQQMLLNYAIQYMKKSHLMCELFGNYKVQTPQMKKLNDGTAPLVKEKEKRVFDLVRIA